MAQWRPISYQNKREVAQFNGGFNNGSPALNIGDNQFSHDNNMDTRDYPAISVRPPITYRNFPQLSALTYGTAEDRYHLIASATSITLFDTSSTSVGNTISTSLNSGYGWFAELRTGANNYVVFLNSTNKKYFETSPSITTALNISDTNLPDGTNIVTSFKGRFYVLKGKTLYFSALNSPSDWTTANDAGSIVISNMVGNGTALVEYNDNLIIFGFRSMHQLTGSGPDTYQVLDIENQIGCYNQRAIAKCQGKLYWISRSGIYEYNGTIPVIVSDHIKYFTDRFYPDWTAAGTLLTSYIAGAVDKYVYFTITYQNAPGQYTAGVGLVYDVVLKIWHRTGIGWLFLRNIQGMLVGLDAVEACMYNIRDVNSTSVKDLLNSNWTTTVYTPISWNFITKPFIEGSLSRPKTLSELYVAANLTTDSTSFSVGYSTNIESNASSSFTTLFSTNAGSSNTQNRRIQVPVTQLQNVPWYRLRLAGTGPATINFLEKNLRVKRR